MLAGIDADAAASLRWTQQAAILVGADIADGGAGHAREFVDRVFVARGVQRVVIGRRRLVRRPVCVEGYGADLKGLRVRVRGTRSQHTRGPTVRSRSSSSGLLPQHYRTDRGGVGEEG